jgi:Rad3-related DNA helicase
LGVFRGKISEGISLNNDYCRCVISVGIPYGNLSEPRVILKKSLLNDKQRAAHKKDLHPIDMPAGQ